jgi:hypothetical protein
VRVRRATGDAQPLADLSGPVACRGREAAIVLMPAPGGALRAGDQAELRFEADGTYRMQLRIREPDPGMRIWLEATGFQSGPGGWSLERSGRLGSR